MTSIPAIGTNHAKILKGLRDSRLHNKLAESKAKKWTTMSQVLQDITDMAIDLERSCGYSFPTFKVQYVSSTNSSSSSTDPTSQLQEIYIANIKSTGKTQMLALSWQTLQKDCPTAPKPKFPLKYKSTKDKQL